MAELLLSAINNRGYEVGDVVYIAKNGHEWSNAELNTNVFTIVKNVPDLNETDASLIHHPDEAFDGDFSIAVNFMDALMRAHNVKQKKRRRYQYNNGVKRKNA